MESCKKKYEPFFTAVLSILLGTAFFLIYMKIDSSGDFILKLQYVAVFSLLCTAAAYVLTMGNRRVIGYGAAIGTILSCGMMFTDSILRTVTEMRYGLAFRLTISAPRSLLVALMLLIPYVFLIITRLFSCKRADTPKRRKDFNAAFTAMSIALLFMLAGYFVAAFITGRTSLTEEARYNWIPFKTIAGYVDWYLHEEWLEPVLLFFGNLLFFAPMGFYIKIFMPDLKIRYAAIIPVVLSASIEISQLLLKTGECDIDDFMLNVAGFFLGIGLKICCDIIRSLATKDAEPTIFSAFSLKTTNKNKEDRAESIDNFA